MVIGLATVVAVVMTRIGDPSRIALPVRGVDVSHHQGSIDWGALAASGISFAFMKASEGRDHRDQRFRENWLNAGRAGIARGAYHYFTFCSSGAAQAENFLDAAPPLSESLPPVADVEFAGNCTQRPSTETVRQELAVFLRRLERAYGRKPMLYVTRETYRRIVSGGFRDYPIWIRNVLWKPWLWGRAWTFWQYTDRGTVAGVSGAVDLNVFRGSRDDFLRFAGKPASDEHLDGVGEQDDESSGLGDDRGRHPHVASTSISVSPTHAGYRPLRR